MDPQALTWQELSKTLARYQISPKQVQVVWIKETLVRGGNFPEKTLQLEADLEAIVHNVATYFPNIKIAYLSSRIYSYTYVRGLSPEPNAYETGFAVKWLIEKQINGDTALNYDPDLGPVQAPYLSWGPYLWADGQNPRADDLVWLQEDLTSDCTHPSESGKQKVAGMLMDFFKNDNTSKTWFLTRRETEYSHSARPGNYQHKCSDGSAHGYQTDRSNHYGNCDCQCDYFPDQYCQSDNATAGNAGT